MTGWRKRTIMEMAREAGMFYREFEDEFANANTDGVDLKTIEAFEALVRADEREEIAQFIEKTNLGSLPEATAIHYALLLKSYANAIRAMGDKHD